LKSFIVMEFDGRFSKNVPTTLLLIASFLKISDRHLPGLTLMDSTLTGFRLLAYTLAAYTVLSSHHKRESSDPVLPLLSVSRTKTLRGAIMSAR